MELLLKDFSNPVSAEDAQDFRGEQKTEDLFDLDTPLFRNKDIE